MYRRGGGVVVVIQRGASIFEENAAIILLLRTSRIYHLEYVLREVAGAIEVQGCCLCHIGRATILSPCYSIGWEHDNNSTSVG